MKKYLYVPIMLPTITEQTRPVIFRSLHLAGADTVFLSSGNMFVPSKMDEDIEQLKKEIPLFEKEGFSVGVWINSFGFGVSLPREAYDQKWTRIKGMLGMKTSAFCPNDQKFRDYYAGVITRLAEAGAKTILLDDDYCLSIRPDVGCSCRFHSRQLRKATGLPIPGNVITSLSVLGKPGRLRKKWLSVMGESLRDFAREMRKVLDKKYPFVRMGVCAGYTSWDWEGVSAYEIACILAGSTRPLLRLTGAPYWLYTRRFGNQDLINIVECIRMQMAWLKGKDIDVFAEDDSYPRPTYHVPAAYLEILDTVVRAEGGAGNLKYMIDYRMKPDTEKGYLNAHNRTMDLYPKIDDLFSGKESDGVRIYEYPEKAALSFTSLKQNNFLERTFFSRAATLLGNAGVPTKYSGDGVGVCFGANVFHLPKEALKSNLILDYPAALKLTLDGLDVGLPPQKGNYYSLLTKTPRLSSNTEKDEETGEINGIDGIPQPGLYLLLPSVKNTYKVQPKEGVTVLSRYDDGSPSSYLYENDEGQRFCVYLFEAASLPFDSDLLRSYPRIRQLKKALAFLGGTPEAYVLNDISGVYLLTKKEGDTLSLGIWNVRPDIASFSVSVPGLVDLPDAPENVSLTKDGFFVAELPAYGSLFLSVKIKGRGL